MINFCGQLSELTVGCCVVVLSISCEETVQTTEWATCSWLESDLGFFHDSSPGKIKNKKNFHDIYFNEKNVDVNKKV